MAGWRAGFPLSRVNMQRFVGSLFSLQPGTTYEVRVWFDAAIGPLAGRTVAASGATRAEPTIPEAADSLYVSPAGSGTVCSEQAPCSLRVAIDRARAGDQILLGGGVYYEGEMALARSGSATAPIVIRARTGAQAILDGADPAPFKWTAQGGGVYRTTLGAPDPRVVVAGGSRLFRYRSLDDLRALRAGVAGFFVSGGVLYSAAAGKRQPRRGPHGRVAVSPCLRCRALLHLLRGPHVPVLTATVTMRKRSTCTTPATTSCTGAPSSGTTSGSGSVPRRAAT